MINIPRIHRVWYPGAKYPFFLLSYCLMTNHIHLQIETTDHSISKIMHHISLNYSKYFNNKYNLVGHLFQNRYHGEIIENLPYMLQTSRYIHLNPVKANIVANPSNYTWSSYSAFMGEKDCELVSYSKILEHFNDDIRLYRKYVENNVHVEDMSDIIMNYENEM